MGSAGTKHNTHGLKQFWNYVFNASYQLLVILAALVTTPFLARNLGSGALGIYGYVVSIATIVQTLALLSLYTYGSRQIAYCRDSAAKVNIVFWELMALRCLLGLAGSAVYICIAMLTPYTSLFMIYYPWVLANIVDVTWLFIGYEDMKVVVLKNVAVKIACVLSIFTFVKHDGLVVYLLIMSTYTLLGNISVYPQLKKYVAKPEIGPNFARRHLSGTLRLFVPEVTSTLTHRINHITMGQVFDAKDEIAFFDQGEKIINIPSSLVTAMNSVVMPRIAHEYASRKNQSVEDYVVWVGSAALMVAFPLSFGIAAIAERIVPWFFGPGFERAIPVIQIMSPVIVVDSLIGTVGAQYLTATNNTPVLNASNGTGLCVNIVMNMLLIPIAGCIGAVLSTVLARLTILVFQVIATFKTLAYERIVRSAIRYAAASSVMAIAIALAGNLVSNNMACTVIQILSGCITYALLLYICGDPILWALLSMLTKKGEAS